jgi:endonuclease/exonuclease/phosphatase family metal-dependent hydrolase
MKLIQANIWGGRINGRLLDFIKDEKPDILCLQEVISYSPGKSILFTPLEEIQEVSNLNNVTFGAKISFNYMQGQAKFGNAILTHYEVLEKNVEFTNLEFTDNFTPEKHDYNVRNLVHVKLKSDTGVLHVLTHHGHHVHHHKDGNDETQRQMQQIADYIQNCDGPVILTGDFNLSPNSKSLEVFKDLINLPMEYNLKTTRNILTNKKEVCDYIFVSKDVSVKSFVASENVVSDHQALILKFET